MRSEIDNNNNELDRPQHRPRIGTLGLLQDNTRSAHFGWPYDQVLVHWNLILKAAHEDSNHTARRKAYCPRHK